MNVCSQIYSQFTPATNLKIGTFVSIANFVIQKKLLKKLQPIGKGPFQKNEKHTDVTYKLVDSNEKKIVQHRKTLLPYYPKEYARREQTQLYTFTGLKVVHDNSVNNRKKNDINCSPQILETKNKENT